MTKDVFLDRLMVIAEFWGVTRNQLEAATKPGPVISVDASFPPTHTGWWIYELDAPYYIAPAHLKKLIFSLFWDVPKRPDAKHYFGMCGCFFAEERVIH